MAKTLSLRAGVLRHSEITVRPVSARHLQRRFQPNPPASLKALSIRLRPFVPETDAFRFRNSFPLRKKMGRQISPAVSAYISQHIRSGRT